MKQLFSSKLNCATVLNGYIRMGDSLYHQLEIENRKNFKIQFGDKCKCSCCNKIFHPKRLVIHIEVNSGEDFLLVCSVCHFRMARRLHSLGRYMSGD